MEVKFNVKRKYIVNGNEYSSLDEMPAAIREAYEKAVGQAKGIEHGNISSISSGKIMFNGQEYESLNSMPPDIRQMYETVMKTVSEGKLSVTGDVDFKVDKKIPDLGKEAALHSYSTSKPIAPKSFLSPAVLLLIGIVLALFVGLYLLGGMGSR